ncbi:unnamed protein product [Urochloa decumbens]|uniref:Protein kinase domain-containing protein n=1 Tax=Urochloa decumbens TaxID=240449 RepID=A0ABC9G667_9POAL
MTLHSVIVVALLLQGTTALCSSLPRCASSCGEIEIPFPFGVGAGCHLPGFSVVCDRSYRPPKLFLGDGTVEVLEISLTNSTAVINSAAVRYDPATGDGAWGRGLGGADGPYYLAERRNRLVVVGCDQQVVLQDGRNGSHDVVAACTTVCAPSDDRLYKASDEECVGVGCCESAIYAGLASYHIRVSSFGSTSPAPSSSVNRSALVFIADNVWFDGNASKLLGTWQSGDGARGKPVVPAVLDWVISTSRCPAHGSGDTACRSSSSFCRSSTSASHGGYSCQCQDGYQDIDECALPEEYPCYGECTNRPGTFSCLCPGGTQGDARTKGSCEPTGLLLAIGDGCGLAVPSLFVFILTMAYILKVRKSKKLKALFFRQNRGLLLQQLVDRVIAERMTFSLAVLEKATNHFDETRKLGSGGHGTVYRGILSNGRAVAIKRSKATIQKEIDDFINEVVILSQINHRNVVRLYGCCLETRVPMLVYEFISNGTLCDHLHVQDPRSLSWVERLRIALEAASALAYLHSSASVSIVHRDVKSANILLDDRLTAKVSDFGASRGIPIDQEGIATAIQGTFGYLDPEYYQTGRLSDKSDVYSFGVVLVEMLTRQKPTVFSSSDNVSLIALFNLLMLQDKLCEILDPQVISEGMEEAKEFAELASTCLSLKGEQRPTMRQVETRLERLLRYNRENEHGGSVELYCTPSQVSNGNTSRQYSVEQEFLLSASLSR